MTRPDAIIFDLDGTLIDSAPDIAAAVNRYLTDGGYAEQQTTFIEQFIGYGPRKLLVDVLSRVGHPTDDAALDRAHDAYLENYRQNPAGSTQFYPHVREDLAALADAGIRLGICTNKPDDMTRRVLEALAIADLFVASVGADAVPACKPDPGHLTEVAGRMGLKDGTWVYVGDTSVDQATAMAAGVPFYTVPWGAGPTLTLPPSHRLNRLSDLLGARTG